MVYLQDIRKAQMLIAKERKCVNAFTVENRFVPAIAYLEWCGVHLDEDKWRRKMSMDEEELKESLRKLNEYVLSNEKLKQDFVSTYTQPSLFDTDGSTFNPTCTVDWNSPKQSSRPRSKPIT